MLRTTPVSVEETIDPRGPAPPGGAAGDYTLTIYFNNQFTAEKAFTVNAAQ